ncbi:tetratricopeptide repeat protein [Paraferrimonas haliotis]|uniref:Sel1 repeat family protein n=1 Tax=Paraferrimonas haliotis TaxID=2013866 RepID=A0AA37WWD6_9GAMM|nr:tetratricopeptide repeat protein [Paraferrimonas haliotis]GLS83357.1 hypothetical protein GCM10007894_13340 [Paraferrimonas haliotis]
MIASRSPFYLLVLLALVIQSPANAFTTPQPQAEIIQSRIALLRYQVSQGDPRAHYLLGVMQLSGRYLPKDEQAALSKLEFAANADYSKAIHTLADFLFNGEYLPRDLAKAQHWYHKLLATEPQWASFQLGFIFASGGIGVERNCGKAIDYFSRVENPAAQNNLVWLLATCPEAKHRDGERAVALGKALLAENGDNATGLDNLAAAYAEVGDFSNAVLTQRRAIEFAQQAPTQDSQLIEELESRLDNYLASQPYRETIALPR